MGGVRVGGVAVVGSVRPILPMMAWNNTSGDYEIYEIGNLAPQTLVASASLPIGDNQPVDPMASPDVNVAGIPREFVYCIIAAASGPNNTVQRVTWEDAGTVQLASSDAPPLGGSTITMMPAFSHDGTLVVYRTTDFDPGDPTVGQTLRVVNRLGGGDTLVYNPASNNFRLLNPVFSSDGAYIAFVSEEDYNPTPITTAFKYRVHVMEADGSNETVIVGPLNGGTSDWFPLIFPQVSWMNNSNTLCYLKGNATLTGNWEWHSIDWDGSNDTNLLTINRAGRAFPDSDPYPSYLSWLTDDSAIVTFLLNTGSGLHELSLIDAGGGGATGLGLTRDYNADAISQIRPLVYQQRIYFPLDDDLLVVESCLEDATGVRTEFDGIADDIQFRGFRGDGS